jgi:hypothetical protein
MNMMLMIVMNKGKSFPPPGFKKVAFKPQSGEKWHPHELHEKFFSGATKPTILVVLRLSRLGDYSLSQNGWAYFLANKSAFAKVYFVFLDAEGRWVDRKTLDMIAPLLEDVTWNYGPMGNRYTWLHISKDGAIEAVLSHGPSEELSWVEVHPNPTLQEPKKPSPDTTAPLDEDDWS